MADIAGSDEVILFAYKCRVGSPEAYPKGCQVFFLEQFIRNKKKYGDR